jgi:hypothetical protein
MVGEVRMETMSGHWRCAAAMAAKSTATVAAAESAVAAGRLATSAGSELESGAETERPVEGGGLLRASATTLAVPEVCRKSEVNSDKYAI